jgi:hypothetical protein
MHKVRFYLLERNSVALFTWMVLRTCLAGCDFECHKKLWLPSLNINWFSNEMVKVRSNIIVECCASLHATYLSLRCSLCSTSDNYLSSEITNNPDLVQCTDHMCPAGVHWHIKNNYMNQWRVKLTISNYNYQRNFSDWNVLVQHPGFSQPATVYSFNSTMLPTVGFGGTRCIAIFSALTWYQCKDHEFKPCLCNFSLISIKYFTSHFN